MKPLNLDNSPCSPTSSNCVIWQGPDLACIKLCKGDTVSDVIAKLATELCTILDELNVNNYDLSCFNSTACPPVDFKGLIQFLINHICALEGVTPVTAKSNISTCPDCVITVASCFIDGRQTTMQLVDYVNMIAERVCSILTSITDLQNQIDTLDIRVTVLENTPPPTFTLPTITVDCTLQDSPYIGFGGPATAINLVLAALINDDTYGYCALRTATGLPASLQDAVASQCITSATLSLFYGTPMGTAYSGTWVGSPATVADAITDLWIALCDIRNFVADLSFAVTDTNTVNLTYTGGVLTAAVQDTGWVRLNGFDFIPDTNTQGPPMVRRIGNVLHFKGTIVVPLVNGGSALQYDFSSGVDSYFLNTTVTPFQGLGGVRLDSGGSITFNNNGAGSCDPVIPTSVIPVGWTIDGNYQNPAGYKLMTRVVPISTTSSTALSTYVSQVIISNGNLVIGLVKDVEATSVSTRGGSGSFDTSHLNTVISHVVSGHHAPKYSSATTELYDNTATGGQPVVIDYESANTYPFSCNANDEAQLGGFLQRLDGLTAFISPCDNLLPTPEPCR
jgi:hypothetical protein